jgi:hypothetical protein
VSCGPAGSRGRLVTVVSLAIEVVEERLFVVVNSDFPLIRLALPGVEHGLISRRHGRRGGVETTVSIAVSHIPSLPSQPYPTTSFSGVGLNPFGGHRAGCGISAGQERCSPPRSAAPMLRPWRQYGANGSDQLI